MAGIDKLQSRQIELGTTLNGLDFEPTGAPGNRRQVTVGIGVVVPQNTGVPIQVASQATPQFGTVASGQCRTDLVYINSSGTLTVTSGTPQVAPQPILNAGAPAVPLLAWPVCYVYIDEDTTGGMDINESDLLDIRPYFLVPGPIIDSANLQPDGSASLGTQRGFARGDHRHPANVDNVTPNMVAISGASGASNVYARRDHTHAHGNLSGQVATQHDSVQVEYTPTSQPNWVTSGPAAIRGFLDELAGRHPRPLGYVQSTRQFAGDYFEDFLQLSATDFTGDGGGQCGLFRVRVASANAAAGTLAEDPAIISSPTFISDELSGAICLTQIASGSGNHTNAGDSATIIGPATWGLNNRRVAFAVYLGDPIRPTSSALSRVRIGLASPLTASTTNVNGALITPQIFNSVATPSAGIYFEINRAATDGTVEVYMNDGASEDRATVASPLTYGWYLFEFRVSSTGDSIDARINGSVVAAFPAAGFSIPTESGRTYCPFVWNTGTGGADTNGVVVDFVYNYSGRSSRGGPAWTTYGFAP
jgi:hypothetical protein